MRPVVSERLCALHAAANGRAGRDWIAALPALIGRFRERWRPTVGEPFPGDSVE